MEHEEFFFVLWPRIHDALVYCPWHVWNVKNRKTLLIFMTNSLKQLSFNFAGMTIGYERAVNVSI
jgi:hypothetical protein